MSRIGSSNPQPVRAPRSPRGAGASNAGDQFHELWALEQALGLLDASKGLTALTIEGIASVNAGRSGDEPFWDGVDCALYFGGQNLNTADRVELVQLKYTTNPHLPWTIAGLTRNSVPQALDQSKIADVWLMATLGAPAGRGQGLRCAPQP